MLRRARAAYAHSCPQNQWKRHTDCSRRRTSTWIRQPSKPADHQLGRRRADRQGERLRSAASDPRGDRGERVQTGACPSLRGHGTWLSCVALLSRSREVSRAGALGSRSVDRSRKGHGWRIDAWPEHRDGHSGGRSPWVRFEERRQLQVRERAELKGFAAHQADIARDESPYLEFTVTLPTHRPGSREAAVILAAAWWRGWDRAAGL